MISAASLSGLTRRFAPWLPLGVFALVALVAAANLVGSEDETLFVGQARPAPVLKIPGLAGDEVSLPGPASRFPILINFWASWCAPCALEHPALMHMAARGVSIMGIAYKDTPFAVVRSLAREGDPYLSVGLDTTGDAGLAYGIAGVPETFVIDAKGSIVFTHRGPLDREAISHIEGLLPVSIIPD